MSNWPGSQFAGTIVSRPGGAEPDAADDAQPAVDVINGHAATEHDRNVVAAAILAAREHDAAVVAGRTRESP